MVPSKTLGFENPNGDEAKDQKTNDFLDDFQLPQIERTTVFNETYTVRRYLSHIFKKGNQPAE